MSMVALVLAKAYTDEKVDSGGGGSFDFKRICIDFDKYP